MPEGCQEGQVSGVAGQEDAVRRYKRSHPCRQHRMSSKIEDIKDDIFSGPKSMPVLTTCNIYSLICMPFYLAFRDSTWTPAPVLCFINIMPTGQRYALFKRKSCPPLHPRQLLISSDCNCFFRLRRSSNPSGLFLLLLFFFPFVFPGVFFL